MDIKLINLQKNKLAKVSKLTNEEKDKYFSEFLYTGLGLKIICKDLKLCDDINDSIDYLCIDESYRLVLVEKREGKNSRTIRSGLLFIDYIKENISKIKMLFVDKIGADIAREVCYDCRLVILTESFTNYDYSSIKCLPYTIEAINYSFLDNNLIFIKEYQNKSKEFIYYNGFRSSLYMELENFLLSLGDDVNIFAYKNVITARKIKAFMYIIVNQDDINVFINNKKYSISNMKDLNKLEEKIEKAYDEN